MKKFIVRALIPAIAVIFLANYRLSGWNEPDPHRRIEQATASGNYAIAKLEYRKLIEQDFFSIGYHRGYIKNHLSQPLHIGRNNRRNDQEITTEYEKYAGSESPARADIGNYGLGYFYAIKGDYRLALSYFQRVKNDSLPYLNKSLGAAYEATGRLDEAEAHYRREIALSADVGGAYSNLAALLQHEKRTDELRELALNPDVRKHIPKRVLRYLALSQANGHDYVSEMLLLRSFNWMGFTGALLILCAWFFYLKQIDVFEPEPISFTVLMLTAGMLFSLLATPLYDILDFYLDFRLTGNSSHDLLFCIFGIGLLEESVKILPVLLMLRFTRTINESVDYLIYGSLSGLGFAFMENLLYFNHDGLAHISARALSAVVLHMTLTSLVMYGLFYSRYRKKPYPVLYFLLTFGAACVVHGVYDFWLLAKGWAGELSILSFVILVFALKRYGVALNCALNMSEYSPKKRTRVVALTGYLCYALTAIVVLQYLFLAISFGPANANRNFLLTMLTSWVLVVVLLDNLGRFEIRKGQWLPFFG